MSPLIFYQVCIRLFRRVKTWRLKSGSYTFSIAIFIFSAFGQAGFSQSLGVDSFDVKNKAKLDIAHLQQFHAAQPNNAAVASALALAYLQRAQQTGELEYVSYARLVLQPWLGISTPPQTILLPRAYLAIDAHDKISALADLDKLQKARPLDPQIQLSRALIYQDLEQFPKAIGLCYELSAKTATEIASACLASVFMAMGQSERAKPLLQSLDVDEGSFSQSTTIWLLRLQTRMAIAQKEKFAEEFYRSKLRTLGAVYEETGSFLID